MNAGLDNKQRKLKLKIITANFFILLMLISFIIFSYSFLIIDVNERHAGIFYIWGCITLLVGSMGIYFSLIYDELFIIIPITRLNRKVKRAIMTKEELNRLENKLAINRCVQDKIADGSLKTPSTEVTQDDYIDYNGFRYFRTLPDK